MFSKFFTRDPCLGPYSVISILSIIVFSLANFPPLVHLHFALKSVTIVRNNSKIVVNNFRIVYSSSGQMNEFKLINIVRIVSINAFYHLAPLLHTFGKCDNFFFVLP